MAGFIERNMIAQSQQVTAGMLSQEVAHEFAAGDFSRPRTALDYDIVSEKMKKLSLGLNIERIKVWDKEKVVIWSDSRELVGKRFPDNEDVAEAFAGKIVCEMSRLAKTEHKFEQEYERLLELYIPIRFDPEGEIENVFEIYKNIDLLYAEISRSKRIIWGSVILGFSFLYFALFTIMRRASKRIEAQNQEIVRSEHRYRSLVTSALDGIISIDSKGKVVLVNKATELIFGYSAQELLGNDLKKLMPEEYRTDHETAVKSFFEAGDAAHLRTTMEIYGQRKNGERFPLELSLSTSGEGDACLVTGILRDITERKRAENLLELSESRFRAVFENVASGILVTTFDGHILMANPHARELLRFDEGVLGENLHDIIPNADELLSRSNFGSWNMLETENGDGQRLVLGFTNKTVTLPDGEGLIVMFQDLTALRHAEERRRRAEQIAYVGEMASRLSHAIKNPLTTVTAGLDLLKNEAQLSAEHSDTVVSVVRDVKQINRIVKNLLDTARSEKFRPKTVSLRALVKDICEPFTNLAKLKNFKFNASDSFDDQDVFVTVDENAFELFLGNLILNSMDAIEKGGSVTVECRKLEPREAANLFPGFDRAVASIKVIDDGPGISTEIRKAVFEPFYTTKKSGTGLGLTVAREIIESHGGVLVMSGSTEKGMSFEAFLVEGKSPLPHEAMSYNCDMYDINPSEQSYMCWMLKMKELPIAGSRFHEQCLDCQVFHVSNLGYYYRSNE